MAWGLSLRSCVAVKFGPKILGPSVGIFGTISSNP